DVRYQAVLATAALGPAAKDAVPDLLHVLRNDDIGLLEVTVAVALGKIGTRAVPALRAALADDNGRVRRGAAYALGLIGPNAYKAVPDLTKALQDREALVRVYAARALGNMQR